MTSELDAQPSPQRPQYPRTQPSRKRSAGHVIAIVLGCLVLFPGLGMLTGGGAIAVGQAVATDDDGFFNLAIDRIDSEGVAVTANHLWYDDVDEDAGPWVLGWLDLDVRLRVEGAQSTDDVFVGIARTADVDRYLDGVAHSEIVELENERPRYRRLTGGGDVESPLDQDFWRATATGDGEQVLDWEARNGRWSIVVMNADGSTDVTADVEIGFRSGAVTPIAVFLLIAGGVVTLTAVALIVIGVRGRRTPEPGSDSRPPQSPLHPQTPQSPLPPPDAEAGTPEQHDTTNRDDRPPVPVSSARSV